MDKAKRRGEEAFDRINRDFREFSREKFREKRVELGKRIMLADSEWLTDDMWNTEHGWQDHIIEKMQEVINASKASIDRNGFGDARLKQTKNDTD